MKRELHFQQGGRSVSVTVAPEGDGWLVTVDGRRYSVQAQPGERGRLALSIDGQRATAHVARRGSRIQVHADGCVWELERSSGARRRQGGDGRAGGALTAPMPGRVLDVLVGEGAAVRKGETLVLLEAMKMELRIAAPADGAVQRIHVAPGQIIERAAPLIDIE